MNKEEKNIGEKKIIVFNNMKIRRIWHNEEWYYSIVDVVGVLSGSENPRKYWNKLIQRLRYEGSEVVTICHQLKLEASDGKMRETDCSNKQGIFRIIQSIPSRRAEPFKLWLAKVGSDRIDEIENPELAQERMKNIYEKKGYSKEWINKRLRGIAIRQNLTDEWDNRGVEKQKEYAILTNEISKATFGKTVQEYKLLKKLEKENLRDHMGDWELILTMVGEKATTDITQKENSSGFNECKDSAIKGGEIAGNTRKELEKSLDKSLVSDKNYLDKESVQKEKKKEVIEIK